MHYGLQKVLELLPSAKLIIVGKGTETLLKHVKRLGTEYAVEIHGEVDEETKMRLLQKAWVLVQTSRKEEFGIVVLEAAMCKTPTVAYNVPGLGDSVKHIETGILIKPRNLTQLSQAITSLLTQHKLRQKVAENVYRYAQQLNGDKSANIFEYVKNP